jgi:hypothetical protein
MLQPGLRSIDSARVGEILQEATGQGALVYFLSTPGLADMSSFFDAIKGTFPLDPPIFGQHSWEALSDSLWEGIYALDVKTVVAIWSDAYEMLKNAPDDYEIALSVLGQVAELLADPRVTAGRPKGFCIYVVNRQMEGVVDPPGV